MWSTNKTILGWAPDTSKQVLTLPPHCVNAVAEDLTLIQPRAKQTSSQRCRHLLGVLCIIIPTVIRERGVFTRLQHTLTYTTGKHLPLSASIHNELLTWETVLAGLAARQTHLRELLPHPRTWSTNCMGGVWHDPSGQWYVCRTYFPQ